MRWTTHKSNPHCPRFKFIQDTCLHSGTTAPPEQESISKQSLSLGASWLLACYYGHTFVSQFEMHSYMYLYFEEMFNFVTLFLKMRTEILRHAGDEILSSHFGSSACGNRRGGAETIILEGETQTCGDSSSSSPCCCCSSGRLRINHRSRASSLSLMEVWDIEEVLLVLLMLLMPLAG